MTLLFFAGTAAAQTPLICGALQTNSISVLGERDVYSYTAVAGEVITIRTLALTAGLDDFIELRDAGSNLLASASSKIDRTLTNVGTYLIVVLDQGNNETGDYALALQRLANPCNATALPCGQVAAGDISAAAELDAFTITSVGGEVFSLQLLSTNTFTPAFDLYTPAGTPLTTSDTDFVGTFTNAGTYTVIVRWSSGVARTGNYWLATEKISAPCNPVVIACGTSTNGSIDIIGELDVFTFTAAGGEVGALKLTSLTSGFGVTMDVFDSTGRALTLAGTDTRFGGVLTNAGLYTVVVRYGSGSVRTGAYSLFFQNVTSPCNSRGAIACGDTGAGFLAPAAAATHSFAGVTGDVVSLRFLTSVTPFPSWVIYEPDGTETELTIFSDTLKRTLTKTGNYLVVVFPPSGVPQISDYVVSLNTVRQPCAAVPLVCGATQAGVITQDGEIHAYTFNAVSNEVVLLRLASVSEFFLAAFDLYDPDGALVGFGSATDLTFTADKTGEHTVLVHWFVGANSGLGEYQLSFLRVSAPCAPNVVTLGTTLNATIGEPEETDLYSFVAGPGPVTICAKRISLSIDPYLQLFTGAGELLGQGYSPFQSTLASNGTYRLLVQNYYSETGDYFLRINNGLVVCSDFDLTLPTVNLFSPANGESVPRGANYTVIWTSRDNAAVVRQEIWLSQDGGQTYTALNTNLAAGINNFVWAVPAGASAAGWRVRVIAFDAAGHSGADETDGTFFVVNLAEQRTVNYAYDVLNQLVLFKDPFGQAQMFAYDSALNRTHNLDITNPNTDTDGDGIDDLWELNHGFDPVNAADGSADSDGDGMSNYAESVACTDPFSASSVLTITQVSLIPAGTQLKFRSRPGRTYVPEWSTNLTAAWMPLPPVTAQFFLTTITNAGGLSASAQFYRVKVQPGTPCD